MVHHHQVQRLLPISRKVILRGEEEEEEEEEDVPLQRRSPLLRPSPSESQAKASTHLPRLMPTHLPPLAPPLVIFCERALVAQSNLPRLKLTIKMIKLG